jgi:hypothetical protein
MSLFLVGARTEDATYWPPGVNDGYGGLVFPSPVSIKCRWQDDNQRVTTNEGDEKVTKSVVYPDQVVEVGGWLYRGVSIAADPRSVTGAGEILSAQSTRSVNGTQLFYKAML